MEELNLRTLATYSSRFGNGVIGGEFGGSLAVIYGTRVATPNDPKLSDGGGWRAGCMVAERRRVEAASVTAVAVRCSAWLGVAVISEFFVLVCIVGEVP